MAEINGLTSFRGGEGFSSVRCRGITFTFNNSGFISPSDGFYNGSDEGQVQFPEFLFTLI